VGGKYSNEWHAEHLRDPRSVVPESNMPPYRFMADQDLDLHAIRAKLVAMRTVGVPYTDDQIENADADARAQVDVYASETSALRGRYGPKIVQGDFDGDPERLTKMDALIAYLQQLGTMVDFSTYQAEDPDNMR
jgi:cytochrome c oxidase cbb3-type subunit 2